MLPTDPLKERKRKKCDHVVQTERRWKNQQKEKKNPHRFVPLPIHDSDENIYFMSS
jgi:predicted kinase